MASKPLVEHFQEDLEAVLDRYCDQGLTLAEAVGTLEILKLNLTRGQDEDPPVDVLEELADSGLVQVEEREPDSRCCENCYRKEGAVPCVVCLKPDDSSPVGCIPTKWISDQGVYSCADCKWSIVDQGVLKLQTRCDLCIRQANWEPLGGNTSGNTLGK